MINVKQKNAPFSVQKYPFLKFLKKQKPYNVGVFGSFLVNVHPKRTRKNHPMTER